MTERLTKWHGDRADCNVGYCSEECDICNMFDEIRTKLAYYEDLEEQSRLMVLPEGFQKEKFINYMANKHCPSNFGFKDENRLQGRCAGGKECEECWRKALKGENYEGCDQ